MTATEITRRVGIRHPVIQGPFGGGVSTPTLVAEVGKAGGLGSYGCYTNSADEITRIARDIRAISDKPFGLNLWVSNHDRGVDPFPAEQFEAAWKIFAPLYSELGVDKPRPAERFFHLFEAQVEAVIEAQPAVFSFIFGIPKPFILAECRRRGIVTMGAATTLAEAEALDQAGVDVILASGMESAGHRPSFLTRAEDSLIGTLPLTRQIASRIKRPIVASGGIGDRAGIDAVLQLGAEAAQLGTAFLACRESGAAPQHRELLLSAEARRTVLTRTLSGRLARGVPNRLVEALAADADRLPPFPVTNWFSAHLRRAAATQGRTDFMALYGSQAAPLLKHRDVASLMADLTAET